MSTSDPEWYELADTTCDPFCLIRVHIVEGVETAETIGTFLLNGLTDTTYIGNLIARHGYSRLEEYIRNRLIPSSLNIQVANFGEIVSGHLLEEEEGLLRPIEKLRYNFNHDWSPHLTDVFSLLVEGEEITAFAYCEVKSGTTRPDANVGAKGYRDLLKVTRDKTPEILHFTSERLWDAHKLADWERLDRAMSSITPIRRILRLALVFDESVLPQSVLDKLGEKISQDGLPDDSFCCYLVTGPGLRTLVIDSFSKMEEVAGTA